MKKAAKKRIITATALIAVLAALAAVYFAVMAQKKASETPPPPVDTDTTVYVAQYDAKNITGISYTWKEQTVDLVFSESLYKWQYRNDPSFPIKFDYPASMATAISTILCDRFVEDSNERFAEYGLDKPYLSITAVYGGETPASFTYNIGAYNSFSDNYYFNIGGTNKVYMVAKGLLPFFEFSLLDMATLDTPPILSDTAVFSVKSMTYGENEISSDKYTPLTDALGRLVMNGITISGYSGESGYVYGSADSFNLNETAKLNIAYTEASTVSNEDSSMSSTVHVDKTLGIIFGANDGETAYIRLDSGLVYTVNSQIAEEILQIIG